MNDPRTCAIPECPERATADGLCLGHCLMRASRLERTLALYVRAIPLLGVGAWILSVWLSGEWRIGLAATWASTTAIAVTLLVSNRRTLARLATSSRTRTRRLSARWYRSGTQSVA